MRIDIEEQVACDEIGRASYQDERSPMAIQWRVIRKVHIREECSVGKETEHRKSKLKSPSTVHRLSPAQAIGLCPIKFKRRNRG